MAEFFQKNERFLTYRELKQKLEAYYEAEKINFIKAHTTYLETSDKNREKLQYDSLYLECECSGEHISRGQGKRKRA